MIDDLTGARGSQDDRGMLPAQAVLGPDIEAA